MLAVTATVATQDNFNNTLNNKRTVPKSGEYFSALIFLPLSFNEDIFSCLQFHSKSNSNTVISISMLFIQ